MCRLFGLSGGRRPVRATFWLLDAPDSLVVQSRAEPDGTGAGGFSPPGDPVVHRSALAAYEDRALAAEARVVESRTHVAHVRYASTGAVALQNTHPFQQRGRLFAHNGVVGDLPVLERELGSYRELVQGETDSERVFALITREAERNGGDVSEAIGDAARWIARNLSIYALNVVLTTQDGLWALRYPATHDLFVLERQAGGTHGDRHFDGTSPLGRLRVLSRDLAEAPAVVVATERMDESPGWCNLASGELLHVDADLGVQSRVVVEEPPAKLIKLEELDERAAASQHPYGSPPES